jgi:hypothetical protein
MAKTMRSGWEKGKRRKENDEETKEGKEEKGEITHKPDLRKRKACNDKGLFLKSRPFPI